MISLLLEVETTYIEELIQKTSTKFTLKDLGTLSYFLGIQRSFTNIIIHLSKQKYIDLIKCT